MRPLDPRLLRRTKAGRPLIAVDSALGLGTAVAVLAQVSLLALIVARTVSGEPLHALWLDFGLLTIAFTMRGGFAWAMGTARELIEDVFSAAANQTVLLITHRSEG
jgi:ATP-binding cassette, subfamily C, bacterial CydD